MNSRLAQFQLCDQSVNCTPCVPSSALCQTKQTLAYSLPEGSTDIDRLRGQTYAPGRAYSNFQKIKARTYFCPDFCKQCLLSSAPLSVAKFQDPVCSHESSSVNEACGSHLDPASYLSTGDRQVKATHQMLCEQYETHLQSVT